MRGMQRAFHWLRPTSRIWRWVLGVAIAAILLAYAFAFLTGEALRRYVEREVNHRLTGYTARIGALEIHPFLGSFELRNSIISQDANPNPPVATIDRLQTTLDWRALRHGRVVADILFERPKIHVDLTQVETEATNEVALKDRGWQQALEAVALDLEINRLRIVDGDVAYVDRGPFKPLHLSRLNVTAENIRNIRSKDRVYPSDVHVESVVFDSGRLWLRGQADFLAEPHPGLLARFQLDRIELDYFKPLANRANLSVRNGTLTATGSTEYAPKFKMAVLERVLVEGLAVDYVHTPQTAGVESERAQSTAKAAQSVSNDPGVQLKIDQLNIVRSNVGLVNRAASPSYRVVLTNADLSAENLSNQSIQGDATVQLKGKLMGTGDTQVWAQFRPKTESGDMDLTVQVEDTAMASLSDVARAYGKFDVAAGAFSMYADLSVRDGTIDGYIKPVVRGLEMSRETPASFREKLYEGLVGVSAKVLKNRPRREIVTVMDVSGRVDQPQIRTWQVVRGLLLNAFIKAVYPGFERDEGRTTKLKPAPAIR